MYREWRCSWPQRTNSERCASGMHTPETAYGNSGEGVRLVSFTSRDAATAAVEDAAAAAPDEADARRSRYAATMSGSRRMSTEPSEATKTVPTFTVRKPPQVPYLQCSGTGAVHNQYVTDSEEYAI